MKDFGFSSSPIFFADSVAASPGARVLSLDLGDFVAGADHLAAVFYCVVATSVVPEYHVDGASIDLLYGAADCLALVADVSEDRLLSQDFSDAFDGLADC